MKKILCAMLLVSLAGIVNSTKAQQTKVTDNNIRESKDASMPVFSWDHIPLYMHMRKAKAFTEEELNYLAGFP